MVIHIAQNMSTTQSRPAAGICVPSLPMRLLLATHDAFFGDRYSLLTPNYGGPCPSTPCVSDMTCMLSISCATYSVTKQSQDFFLMALWLSFFGHVLHFSSCHEGSCLQHYWESSQIASHGQVVASTGKRFAGKGMSMISVYAYYGSLGLALEQELSFGNVPIPTSQEAWASRGRQDASRRTSPI